MSRNEAYGDVTRSVRFVVLAHSHPEGDHFDLMIDYGEKLATWKSLLPPEVAAEDALECTRLADHRRIYLEYVGPISGARGHVSRYDAGMCSIASDADGDWRVRFKGAHLAGEYRLTRTDDQGNAWRLRHLSE